MTDTIKISRELRPVLSMILNALDRDAAEGKAARGEMAAEMRALLAQPAPAQDSDTVAMQTAAKIMELVYGPMPIGGSVQLRAQVQCLVHDAIGQSPAQDGWIPVSERLPEPETDVLVRGVKHNGVLHTVSGLFHDQWMSQETEEPTAFEVTHWQPLPPPPPKESK